MQRPSASARAWRSVPRRGWMFVVEVQAARISSVAIESARGSRVIGLTGGMTFRGGALSHRVVRILAIAAAARTGTNVRDQPIPSCRRNASFDGSRPRNSAAGPRRRPSRPARGSSAGSRHRPRRRHALRLEAAEHVVAEHLRPQVAVVAGVVAAHQVPEPAGKNVPWGYGRPVTAGARIAPSVAFLLAVER